MPSILIVEDDITFSLMLKTWLGKKGFEVKTFSSVSDAKRQIENGGYDLILSDLRLPDGDGIDLLKWVKEKQTSLPLIMMTSYAEIQTAVQAIKLGASDYIAKPLNPEELLGKIRELIKTVPAEHRLAVKSSESNTYIEGQSPAARQLFDHVRLVAPTDMSVLITGASGTGKEYIARRIHEQSNRSKAPFIAVDCGAIPKDLAASEFFGHVKGSFTGAIDNKTGAFVAAQGGTIFLDEIGNLTYEVQVQLLRALQERKIKPIGTNDEIAINVRLISATNENLRTAIEKGDFREDLYHRINEFTVRIPDLKERKEDLLLFANNFLDQANAELQKDIIGFDNETIRLFQSYSWPGNLRQMKNVIKYATLLATGRYITRHELPEELTDAPAKDTRILLKDEAHESELIKRALQESGNNKTRAAQLLGIDRKTLYNKLKLYNLD
ncbi:sigma-54-dependent Fis family transcriptional regulator [Parabacteroides faecis]|uniref:sigma-54-dependent transcriptional regulator n=1 Tax=Parabacteroides TaxID=375288 RepID=UPI000F00E032|nr:MULTISPECIES: sigma-54 dependent transcriptional regulator [Parabacteroides]MBC8617167.1 sigma-54-dependent Fis family transcriptional regulator [Parabacteroides faecis]RHS01115.1 sigma-54-dependent Fis family transcriptional regulator [Parabacteroides sp. AF14-59]